MNRLGVVYNFGIRAGVIEQVETAYIFTYDDSYLNSSDARPVSLTLPLIKESYRSQRLFPFFDNLIPEGWLLTIAQKNWKLDAGDRMGLLLTVCQDCIGSVHVVGEGI